MKINPYKYPFIAIEGIDGCGKSTLIEGLQKWDKESGDQEGGIGSVFTKEPTDGSVGVTIRRILNNDGCDAKGRKFDQKELQGLYILDRLEHRQPEAAFLELYPIISDRDFPSTMAYGIAGGLSPYRILNEHNDIIGDYFFAPDLIIILDLPAEEAMKRNKKAQKDDDYFTKLAFQKRVRNAYLAFPVLMKEIYREVKLHCAIIDAMQSPKKVLEDSLFWINKCFQEKLGATEHNKIFKKKENISYCDCPNPIGVVSSLIDTVETCKFCGKIIKDKD